MKKKPAKRGRPKLPEDSKRLVYSLMVSPEERDLLDRAAANAGLPPRTWCRETLLAQARKVLGE